MKNIVLTGFMATGKTVIGKRLATLAGFDFIDTDELIVENEKRTINSIFAENGEEAFREMEKMAIRVAAIRDNAVISTGGGAVLCAENIACLRKNGCIVNLEPAPGVLLHRIAAAAKTRPLLREPDDDIISRYLIRKPFYDNCDIKIIVSDEKSPAQFAQEILKKYQLHIAAESE